MQRDARGVHPGGIQKMSEASFEWAKTIVRRLFGV